MSKNHCNLIPWAASFDLVYLSAGIFIAHCNYKHNNQLMRSLHSLTAISLRWGNRVPVKISCNIQCLIGGRPYETSPKLHQTHCKRIYQMAQIWIQNLNQLRGNRWISSNWTIINAGHLCALTILVIFLAKQRRMVIWLLDHPSRLRWFCGKLTILVVALSLVVILGAELGFLLAITMAGVFVAVLDADFLITFCGKSSAHVVNCQLNMLHYFISVHDH